LAHFYFENAKHRQKGNLNLADPDWNRQRLSQTIKLLSTFVWQLSLQSGLIFTALRPTNLRMLLWIRLGSWILIRHRDWPFANGSEERESKLINIHDFSLFISRPVDCSITRLYLHFAE